jgi:hypothetical protein
MRRKCFLKRIVKGKTELTKRRGRRRKHMLDVRKEKKSFWKLKEDALNCSVWRTRFVRSYGQFAIQNDIKFNNNRRCASNVPYLFMAL